MKTTEIINDIEKNERLMSYEGEDKVISLTEARRKYYADKPPQKKYLSKLTTLDKTLDGFYPGQLITTSGKTGQGKTTLQQTFTMALWEQAAYPLWFSYEVPVNDFCLNFSSDYHDFIFLPQKLSENSLEWIEQRIVESMLKHKTKTVFIDHLHYLVQMNPMANYSYVIGEKVRALKLLAVKHNIIIFLVAHMINTRGDHEPSLGDIRDSSFIEQESDVVLYCWRWEKDTRITIVKVAKNRRRGIVDKKIGLVLNNGRYFEKENSGISEGK